MPTLCIVILKRESVASHFHRIARNSGIFIRVVYRAARAHRRLAVPLDPAPVYFEVVKGTKHRALIDSQYIRPVRPQLQPHLIFTTSPPHGPKLNPPG